jgi:hypothetical protein
MTANARGACTERRTMDGPAGPQRRYDAGALRLESRQPKPQGHLEEIILTAVTFIV